MPTRPDITLRCDSGSGEFLFQPHSARGNAFLAEVFAHVEGDLTRAEAFDIVREANALGLVVWVR